MKIASVLSPGRLCAGPTEISGPRQDARTRLSACSMSTDVPSTPSIIAPDKGIPEEVLSGMQNALSWFRILSRAALSSAPSMADGIATCRTQRGWSAPAFVSIGGGSWGLQIGVEGVDLVMLVMNYQGLQHLLSSKFQVSADASASAGPVGRHASAGTDWKLNTEILTYSRSRGVFAGITLDGAVVEQDNDSTRAIYGRDPSFRTILSGRSPRPVPRSTL